ncbi:MAG TPA: hypothetical protein VND92_07820, partial [Vicinamibacterales bacterium]|nr:hypothetical protein [Vicinamibacterales bacterium]
TCQIATTLDSAISPNAIESTTVMRSRFIASSVSIGMGALYGACGSMLRGICRASHLCLARRLSAPPRQRRPAVL